MQEPRPDELDEEFLFLRRESLDRSRFLKKFNSNEILCGADLRSSYESMNEYYCMDAGACLMYRWQNIGVQILLLLASITLYIIQTH